MYTSKSTALCKNTTSFLLTALYPKVYSAANLEGAIFTSVIILKKGRNILLTSDFSFPSLEFALHDLTQILFAPPIFAANKSKKPIGVSQSFNTY